MINLFQPSIGDAEIEAIREVFASRWLGPGLRAQDFERMFARYIGRPEGEVLAVASCTEALFQAVIALGIGAGDDVILPSVSFVGAAHAARNAGARVVLCDVDPATLNPRFEHFEQAITPNTKAAIVLHYGGYPGHATEISRLAADRSFPLIEDAAIALGSFTGDKACGTLGDIGCWSFDSMKTLATGDGGMVWARRPQVLDRIRNATRLGLESSGFHRRTSSERWWELEPAIAGRWAPMNDLTSALGLAQLKRLPGFLDRRAQIATAYDAGLSDLSWLRTPPAASERTARTFYWIQTAPAIRDALARRLLERDIYTSFRYWPLHKTQMYRSPGSFPGADAAAASTLLLPLHQELSDGDVDRVIETVRSFGPRLNK